MTHSYNLVSQSEAHPAHEKVIHVIQVQHSTVPVDACPPFYGYFVLHWYRGIPQNRQVNGESGTSKRLDFRILIVGYKAFTTFVTSNL